MCLIFYYMSCFEGRETRVKAYCTSRDVFNAQLSNWNTMGKSIGWSYYVSLDDVLVNLNPERVFELPLFHGAWDGNQNHNHVTNLG